MTPYPTAHLTSDLLFPCGTELPRGLVVRVHQVIEVRTADGRQERVLVLYRGKLWQVTAEDVGLVQ